MFNDLPPELLRMICILLKADHLDDHRPFLQSSTEQRRVLAIAGHHGGRKPLLQFSIVCRRTREAAEPFLFSCVRYPYNEPPEKDKPWEALPRGYYFLRAETRELEDKDILRTVDAVKASAALKRYAKVIKFQPYVKLFHVGRSSVPLRHGIPIAIRPPSKITIFEELRESFALVRSLRELIINIPPTYATDLRIAWQSCPKPLFPLVEKLTTDGISLWLNEHCPDLKSHKVFRYNDSDFEQLLAQVCNSPKLEEFHIGRWPKSHLGSWSQTYDSTSTSLRVKGSPHLDINSNQFNLMVQNLQYIKRLGLRGPVAAPLAELRAFIKDMPNVEVLTLTTLNDINVRERDKPAYVYPFAFSEHGHLSGLLRIDAPYHIVARRLLLSSAPLRQVLILRDHGLYNVFEAIRDSDGRLQSMREGWRRSGQDVVWCDLKPEQWVYSEYSQKFMRVFQCDLTPEQWVYTKYGQQFMRAIGA